MTFEMVTFILSGTFIVLALEKLFYLIFFKKNMYKKYNFDKSVVFGLAMLDLFGAITIHIKYTLIGSLGVLTLFCLCLGSIYYNIKHKTYKETLLAWIGLLCSLTIFLEYIIIK
jgi:hypothetical protein